MEYNLYEISAIQLIRAVIKRWWIILIAVLIGGSIAYCYINYFVTPTYSTYAKVGVNSYEMSSYQDVIAGQSISKECASILVSNITLERAAEKLNAHDFAENGGKPYRTYNADVLLSMIKAVTSADTRYLDVRVTSIYPAETKLVAEVVTQSFCEVLKVEDVIKGGEGKIIHRPVTPTSPTSPNKTMAVTLGLLIGGALSVALIVFIHVYKDVIDSKDRIVEAYGDRIPLLAVIPDINEGNKSYSAKYYKKYKRY